MAEHSEAHAAPFGNATLHYPYVTHQHPNTTACHTRCRRYGMAPGNAAPSRVDVVGASPSLLIMVTPDGHTVTLPMVDGLPMGGYSVVMDSASTITRDTL